MKGNPAGPGGLLVSKPTWSSTLGVFGHVGFFCCQRRKMRTCQGRYRARFAAQAPVSGKAAEPMATASGASDC